jgi:chromosome segregation ATPase
MELPAQTLKLQLAAVYRALHALDMDRRHIKEVLATVETSLREEQARAANAEARLRGEEARAAKAEASLREELVTAAKGRKELREERARAANVEANLEASLREEQARTATVNADLGRVLNERDILLEQIREIHASSSWRLTRPVRGAARALRRIRFGLRLARAR